MSSTTTPTSEGNPLERDDREDRIRPVFSRWNGSRLPPVCKVTLGEFYRYLAARLVLPFCVQYYEESERLEGTDHTVTVVDLPDPAKYPVDTVLGLLCKARFRGREVRLALADLRVDEDSPNHQLIEDFWYWLWNWR